MAGLHGVIACPGPPGHGKHLIFTFTGARYRTSKTYVISYPLLFAEDPDRDNLTASAPADEFFWSELRIPCGPAAIHQRHILTYMEK